MWTVPYVVVVALIAVFFVFPAFLLFRWEEHEARKEWDAARASERNEPVSMQPWVDPSACIGCGTCVLACPEGKILRVVDGQARMVGGSHCVGHGACAAACPTSAIELVFGSERRGIDLPEVNPDFSSNVPGLYVAGELGGMGLIANAVEQGIQAVDHIAESLESTPEGGFDLVIVGGGPAGIAAGMEAILRGLRVLVLEQGEFGGAVRHYPRQKLVMSRGFCLPGMEAVPAGTIRKEALIEVLEAAVSEAGLRIAEKERVTAVVKTEAGHFRVQTDQREVAAARVLLAVGRRGTPRQLGVPGEERTKVMYRLLEPERFTHSHILVVGGGDSALEAALALCEQPGNRVTLSYRRREFSRANLTNDSKVQHAAAMGKLTLLLESNVTEIGLDRVTVDVSGDEQVLANDFVFVFAGGVLPTEFLKAAGITLERHFGRRRESI